MYCDEDTPCAAGQVCNTKTKTCEPRRDGVIAGPADAGPRPDSSGADQQGDALRANGASCADAGECQSGFCVDAVCCDAICEGTCRSCALAGRQGSCSLVPGGQDPREDCAGEAPSCGGRCDGEGSCSFAQAQTRCAPSSCGGGTLTLSECDGAGICVSSQQSCGGYACAADGMSCRTRCSTLAECTGTFQCLDGHCVNQLGLGEACGSNNLACASGNCVDGVCCQDSSCGACQRCNLAGQVGHCSAVPDDNACGAPACISGSLIELLCDGGACQTVSTSCSPYLCNSAGVACRSSCANDGECAQGSYCAGTLCVAKKQNGVSCGDDRECLTGTCTDKERVCCDRDCGGDCESCAGLPACTFKTAGTPCGPKVPYCVNEPFSSSISEQTCTGLGACEERTVQLCNPYRCSGTTPACSSSCEHHDDCTSGLCDLLLVKNSCRPASEVCHANSAASCSAGTGAAMNPFCKIQSCLDQVASYVAVADGTYSEALSFSKNTRLISTGTSGLIRGSSSNSPRVVLQPPAASTAGIASSGSHEVVIYGLDLHPAAPPAAFSGTLVSVINGSLTLISSKIHAALNGHCLQVGNGELYLADAEVYDCQGDAIHAEASRVELSSVNLTNNGGNGLWQDASLLVIGGADIADNTNHGLMTYSTAVTVDRCYAYGNGGNGFRFENGTSGSVYNSLAAENVGSGIVSSNNSSPPLFFNITAAGNEGGAIVCGSQATTIYNTISRGYHGGSCNFHYSNVSGSGVAPGTSNINEDPQFLVLAGKTIYTRIASTSPCVDAGLDAVPGVTQMPPLDYSGQPRFVDKNPGGRIIDIGAVEVQ